MIIINKKFYFLIFMFLGSCNGMLTSIVNAANPSSFNQIKRFYLYFKPGINGYLFLLKQVGNTDEYGASYQLGTPNEESVRLGASLLNQSDKDPNMSQIYTYELNYNPKNAPLNKYFWIPADRLSKALIMADDKGQGAVIEVADLEGISPSVEKLTKIKVQDGLINRLRANPEFISKYIGIPTKEESKKGEAIKRFYLFFKNSYPAEYYFLLKRVGMTDEYGASYQLDTLDKEQLSPNALLLKQDEKDPDTSQIYTYELNYLPQSASANKYFWVPADRLLKAIKAANEKGQGGVIDVSDLMGISLGAEKLKDIKVQDALINRLRANPGFMSKFSAASSKGITQYEDAFYDKNIEKDFKVLETGELKKEELLNALNKGDKDQASNLIKDAFKKASLVHHPDKIPNFESLDSKEKEKLTTRYREIIDAKTKLLNALNSDRLFKK